MRVCVRGCAAFPTDLAQHHTHQRLRRHPAAVPPFCLDTPAAPHPSPPVPSACPDPLHRKRIPPPRHHPPTPCCMVRAPSTSPRPCTSQPAPPAAHAVRVPCCHCCRHRHPPDRRGGGCTRRWAGCRGGGAAPRHSAAPHEPSADASASRLAARGAAARGLAVVVVIEDGRTKAAAQGAALPCVWSR